MKIFIISTFFLFILIGFQGCVAANQKMLKNEQNQSPHIVFVPFCELLKDSDNYDNQEIETTGIFYFARESAFVYDPQCVDEKDLVWIEISDNPSNKKIDQYLNEETSEEYKTHGVFRVMTRFSGVFQIKKDQGFGHLNSFNYFFKVNDIKEILPMPKDVPYPWKRANKEAK